MVSLIFVLSLLSLSGKGQAMTHFPLNAAVVVGQTVTFNCRTESHNSVWWKYKPIGSKTDCLLFNRKILEECGCDNCTVNNSEPGQYDLQITNTRQSDAGTYSCVDNKETDVNVSKADSHSAELIVLASVPECGSNLTGSNASLLKDNDSVRMWCVVYFRGNIAPVMKWRNKENDEIIPPLNNNHPNRQVESEIIIQLKHDDNRGIVYSCTTYFNHSFSDAHVSYSVAKNTPDYTYTWTSQNESYWRKHHTPTRSEFTSARPHAEETARNCRDTVIGLGTSVTILATSTLAFFVGCLIAVKRIRKAKKERHLSSNTDDSQNVRRAVEYEDLHEAEQQSLGLPVYQNVPALQTGYMELEIIDQQPQQPRNYTTLRSLH